MGLYSRFPEKREVRHWYFPADVVALLVNGEISPRELVVMGAIDSLTQTFADGRIIWCFATNEYLAEICGISKHHLSDIISRLVEKGLVRRKFKERPRSSPKRYLKTSWRKPPVQRKPDPCPEETG